LQTDTLPTLGPGQHTPDMLCTHTLRVNTAIWQQFLT
jgi:hypothetical protein